MTERPFAPPSLTSAEAPPPSRREDIIREAAKLFLDHGYHGTSMEEIATAVGLRKPTLYHYFGSKDQILFWLHEEFIDLLIERQNAREKASMPPEQQLLETMSDVLELMATHRGHVRVFFEHHRELPADQHAAIAAKRTAYQATVTTAIEHAIAAGNFRPIDAKLATLAVFGACNWTFQWYHAEGPLQTRQIAFAFWDLLVRGLLPNAAPISDTEILPTA